MRTDAVVIGGGVTGLAAGALLARAGRSAVVLEKGNVPGGRAYTYEERGFTLNYGPHAIYRPHTGVLAELLAEIGAPMPGFGYPQPSKAFWTDGERFGALGTKPQEVLGTSLLPLASRLRLGPMMAAIKLAKPAKLEDVTWGDWVARKTKDEHLRRLFNALATVNSYTRPASQLSAGFLLRHLQENLWAKDYVGYMSGGWRAMYEAFIDALEAHGGRVVTGARVERLEAEGGRITAAVTAGERYEADAFVCALPPQDLPRIADGVPALAEQAARWAQAEDVRAYCIDLGLSRRMRTDLTYIFDVRRDLYYSLHSEVTPDLAPKGSLLLHAMAYLSPEEARDERLVQQRAAALEAGLDRHFAGWREAVVVERRLENTRVAVLRQTPGMRGLRMPLRAEGIGNLYFAGDARDVPGNLTEICLKSAMQAAHAAAASVGAPTAVPA